MRNGWTMSLLALTLLLGCSREQSPAEKPAANAASTPVAASGPAQKCDVEKLAPAELRAVDASNSVGLLASLCGGSNSFETLWGEGCQQQQTGMTIQIPPLQGQMKDPRQDPDYEFVFRSSRGAGTTFSTEVEFNPKRPGLAGVFNNGPRTYCNTLGRATVRPDLLLDVEETNRVAEKVRGVKGKKK